MAQTVLNNMKRYQTMQTVPNGANGAKQHETASKRRKQHQTVQTHTAPNSINGAKQHKWRQTAQMTPNSIKTAQTASNGANANGAKQQTNGVK
jgi:hypothetical protein